MKTLLAGLTALLVGAACICRFAPGYYAFLLGLVAVTALVGIGLNVLYGLVGEVSLGQAGFLALGAYGVAILTTKAGLNFWAALPVTIIAVAAISAVLSVPALRVSGPYLAMVTIAFGFIVESVSIEWGEITGGASGISGIPAPFPLGGMAMLICLFAALGTAGFYLLARSPLGLAMRAVASAPAAARSIGIGPLPVRTVAFVLAAAAAGLAGVLQAALTGFIAPSSFPFSQSILFLLAAVVGGAGRTWGPIIGAAVVGLLPEALAGLAEYRLLVFGAALLIVLWMAPGGIAGLLEGLRKLPQSHRGQTDPAPALALLDGKGGGLQARDLRVAFGGVVAVGGVSLDAPGGRITSLIGPNGAGKTTLLNLVSGFQRGDAGTVRAGDLDLTGLPAHRVARAGLARTFQTAQPFGGLSVLDNIRLGLLRGRWRGEASPDLARSLLALVGYTGSDAAASESLPHVDRRLLEIARALATCPTVLLLDEPAAGLDHDDTRRLDQTLQRLARAGLAIVLVEHDMSLVMSVSDEVVVVDAGRRIASGNPAAIRADPAVKAAYLGAAAPPAPKSAERAPGATLLQVRNLCAGYGTLRVLADINMSVRQGETIAVLGPNGAGKSTLMKALSGLLRPISGRIEFAGEDLSQLPAHRIAARGLTLVPEGRQVFPALTVEENLRLGATRRSDFDAHEIEAMLARFPRLRPRLHTPAGLLSGGEQQMLAVARGLLSRPTILLLDEPSLGLAPAIASELFTAFAQLRDEGMTLVIVDQMTDYALSIADRGYVLGGGRIIAESSAAALRESALDEAYLGALPAVAS
ncbi:MAG: branched-chain amino acid transport system ATP-binding protein livF [Methylobacteriaceae bacterium]|nr:branched-chain amino acid transport system ATP-binding protein livF [Methylobacteriaceae bacterium]